MKYYRLLPIACCLILSACGEGQNARDLLGLGRNAPDEFKVVSRPPLVVPPDFALRPPSEGDDYASLPAADSAARAAVTGTDEEDILGTKRMMGDAETAVGVVRSFELGTQADDSFLSSIGADKADASIRQKLQAEQTEKTKAKEEKDAEFLGWLKPEENDDEVIVDAKAEKDRLQKNKEAGKSVLSGETPTIDPKPEGILGKIF